MLFIGIKGVFFSFSFFSRSPVSCLLAATAAAADTHNKVYLVTVNKYI